MGYRAYNAFAVVPRTMTLAGSVTTDGSGVPSSHAGDFPKFGKVTKNGTGDYTLTLTDAQKFKFLAPTFSLIRTTAGTWTFQVHTVTPASGTIRFLALSSGVATDLVSLTLNIVVEARKAVNG